MKAFSSAIYCLYPALLLAVAPVSAGSGDPVISYSIDPQLSVSGGEGEAQLQSGLGLALRNEVLAVSVNYKLQSLLKDEGELDANAFSQHMGASVHSSALNELLGLRADISADSQINAGEGAYRYRVIPAFSKSLADLADLNFQYQYELDKTSAQALEKEKKGYSMGLKGSLQQGRLTWKGDYRTTDVFEVGLAQTQSNESLEFESRYRVVSDLHLELSSAIKDETRFADGTIDNVYSEKRYGAGLAWSPSRHYSLAFKVNKLNEERTDEEKLFGSGTVSWFPQRNLEFSLSYGDQLIEGARGLMLSTRINLDKS